ncbi:hypothetical protein [Actinoplanes sp. ATCC 53533]|uniref:hypothetical protein n=1 Tax=Actinoplanes sp. ATCC 53533 TaxID=1288362 RepID=UPI000F7730F7|nr:hypothetical protein [Actinoplanes sp. ATCC 53533]
MGWPGRSPKAARTSSGDAATASGSGSADPFADLVGYRQGVLWLSDEEVSAAAGEIQAILAARAGNRAAPGRRPRLLSLTQFPTEPPPAAAATGGP